MSDRHDNRKVEILGFGVSDSPETDTTKFGCWAPKCFTRATSSSFLPTSTPHSKLLAGRDSPLLYVPPSLSHPHLPVPCPELGTA